MNSLKLIYQNKPEIYKETMKKMIIELKDHADNLEELYAKRNYSELKMASHTIRNLASAAGQSKLKILAAYWEDICAGCKEGDIVEFKQTIQHALIEIEKETI